MEATSNSTESMEYAPTQATLAELIAQIDALRSHMKADDRAIAQYRAESAMLKAQGYELREETRRIFDNAYRVLNGD